MMQKRLIWLVLASVLLVSCGKDKQEQKKGPPPAVVTVVKAEVRSMQALEKSVGVVESDAAPMLAAEVSGQVRQVLVEAGQSVKAGQTLALLDDVSYAQARTMAAADVRRLEAQLATQKKQTERSRELFGQKFISAAGLEQSEAQLTAAEAQLAAARAALVRAGHDAEETRIVAPITGQVEQRLVAVGDFVTPGKPLFQLSSGGQLRVSLPFPETAVQRIRAGQEVRLSLPSAPGQPVLAKISEIRPMIGSSNRAFEAIVALANPAGWKPGASVTGEVVTASREALAVPSVSVVMRPAGSVVYMVEQNKAVQKIVQTGLTQGDLTEIVSGLQPGQSIALDGAGFLTDGAAVAIKPVAAK